MYMYVYMYMYMYIYVNLRRLKPKVVRWFLAEDGGTRVFSRAHRLMGGPRAPRTLHPKPPIFGFPWVTLHSG